jgi:acylphosphatase
MSGDRASLHLWITGSVQGVFYRASTRTEALALGLEGWVRNLPDGRVEAYAVGRRTDLLTLLDWCRVGPTHASVEHVECEWDSPSQERGFEIRA